MLILSVLSLFISLGQARDTYSTSLVFNEIFFDMQKKDYFATFKIVSGGADPSNMICNDYIHTIDVKGEPNLFLTIPNLIDFIEKEEILRCMILVDDKFIKDIGFKYEKRNY